MSKLPTTSQKPWYKRISWIILIFLIAVLACMGGWQVYKDSNPQSYINFTQYAPGKIVDNLQVKDKVLEAWAPNALLSFMTNNVDIILNLNQEHSYIGESQYKATQFDSTCDGINVTCTNKTSSEGQSYRLVLTRQPSNLQSQPLIYDKLTEQEVTFSKGNTGFIIDIQSKNDTPISDKDWSDMIDSFKPTTLNDLHVKHMQPGP